MICFAVILLQFQGKHVTAQSTYNWLGSGQSEEFYEIPSNWLQNAVPGSDDVAQFYLAFAFPMTLKFETDQTVDELQILKSDYTFRGFNFADNTPTIFSMQRTDIEAEAKLTLQNGFNGRSFELTGDKLFLSGELNILEGTTGTFSDAFVGDANSGIQSLLTVSGQLNSVPSRLDVEKLEIGNDGMGRVVVEDGAVVSVSNSTQVGLFAGAGEFHLSGDHQTGLPSRFSSNTFAISPPGEVTISGRSEFSIGTFGSIVDPGDSLDFTVSGSDARVELIEFQHGGGDFLFQDGSTLMTEYSRLNFGASSSGSLVFESTSPDQLTTWHNSGNVNLAGQGESSAEGGRISIDGAAVQIGQTLKIYEAGEFLMNANQNVPSILVVDTIENTQGGQLELNGGKLSVNWFEGDLENLGATLAPGDDIQQKWPGRTLILGDYIHGPDATLAIDVGGMLPVTEYDLVEMGGYMVLEGDLELNLQNGFIPDPSDEIVILSAAAVFGDFANVQGCGRLMTNDGSGSFKVSYGFSSSFSPDLIVLSEFESASFLLGDVNGDGAVNLLDVTPFVNALSNGKYISAADVNQDGNLDLLDVQPFVDLLTG